eukprot:TRINITY_DN8565_c0_g1_i9.p3 TRINITY_DN8565_c0_g1~~TRINITY_DN8565_c0_g1_i9.p3  ORF type:complete len:276 (+),score=52.21 TRINITY_DN8565_c0_g1_i9:1352-2179(+)
MVDFSVIDAFTSKAFGGNPACVILMPHATALSDSVMANIAKEMNLSETTFLTKLKDEDHFNIRWFTPDVEVDLCGHATVAASHFLFSNNHVAGDVVHFTSLSGPLKAQRDSEGRIVLDFPEEIVKQESLPAGVLPALGLTEDDVHFQGRNRLDYFIEVKGGLTEIEAIRPNFTALKEFNEARCVIVSAKGDGEAMDVVSRVFAPTCGIDEDPVTGSAHCGIGPYWASKLGKDIIRAIQASGRRGHLEVEWKQPTQRVLLKGHAVTVSRGTIVCDL